MRVNFPCPTFKVENSDFKVMRAIAHAHLCDYNASLTTVVFRYQELEEDVVTNAEDIEEWCQKDVDARTFIYSTINNDQQCSLHGCKTAAEMWTRITTEYAQSAADNEHLVMAKFFDYKYQPGQSVMAHVTAIEQIAAHLKNLGSAVSDVQIMSKILLTLPPSFRHFLSAWDNVPTAEKTIKLLTTRLVSEESRTKQYNHGEQDPSDQAFFAMHSPQPQALFAHQGGSSGKRGRGRGKRQDFNRGVTCDYCHIKGHSSAVCRNKVRDSKQGKDYNRNLTCDYCHKRGHSATVCWHKIKDDQPEESEENNETDL